MRVFRHFFLFLALFGAFFALEGGELLNITVSAKSALLINADTGTVLYEKNADQPNFPASTTKIATGLYALIKKGDELSTMIVADVDSIGSVTPEKKRQDNYNKYPSYWLETDASHFSIKAGEKLSFKDLLYGTFIVSGDDASNVIAKFVSGSVPAFMDEVNAYLKDLGCKNTHFTNPHGLHHPDHKTTATDLALIAREAMKNPLIREMVSTVRYTRPKTNKQEATPLVQSNRLLKTGTYYYPKAIGIKTGYHSNAGHNLVAAAKDGNRTLIAVILHNKERNNMFKDAIKMFDAAFNQPKMQRTLLKAGVQKYALKLKGGKKPAVAFLKEDLNIEYFPAEEPEVKAMMFWDKVKLPIAKGQRIGELRVISTQNTTLKAVPVYSLNDVKASWWHSASKTFGTFGWISWSMLALSIFLCSIWAFRAQERR